LASPFQHLCPFVLLDGHQSQFDQSFLKYINDPNHKWVVAIRVPYGMHIWQVGNLSEQNGSFKMSFKRLLNQLGNMKQRLGLPLTYVCEDIVPLVLWTFPESYGRKEENLKAIKKRGWGQDSNCALLEQPS
jgi:hypothetical protein